MSRRARRLSGIVNFDDARRGARSALPRMIFDYLDGGADEELTMHRNARAFRDVEFRPRLGIVNPDPDLKTAVLGVDLAMPILTAPVGGMPIVRPEGDIAIARAAERAGIIYVQPSSPGFTIEAIAKEHGAPTWLQVYNYHDDRVMESLMARARLAGVVALLISVDTHLQGKRERDLRNGFSPAWRMSARSAVSDLSSTGTKPRWLYRYLRAGRPLALTNDALFSADGDALLDPEMSAKATLTKSATMADVPWIRTNWDGPIILKGVLSAEDARRAIDLGVDALIVSNYGGRSLDGAPAALEVLPGIVDAVGNDVEVLFDGGVQRGSDIVKALSLGARAVLVGKMVAFGLAVGGQAGVERVLDLLRQDLVRTMRLLGCTSIRDLDRSWLRESAR